MRLTWGRELVTLNSGEQHEDAPFVRLQVTSSRALSLWFFRWGFRLTWCD